MSPFVQSLRAILPESVLVATACLLFLLGPFFEIEGAPVGQRRGRIWSIVSLAALLAAACLWNLFPADVSASLSLQAVRSDPFVWFIRGVALLAGLVLVLINWDEVADEYAAELHGTLLAIIAGVSLTAAANDLVILFLALELVSIPTYVFLYLRRREPTSPEATLKYFLLSIFSSAIVLYGFSFLYGAVGTTNLAAIHDALDHHSGSAAPSILLIAAGCIVAGLSFRVTAVPFHFYAPDVFQGSHAGANALLAFVPKIVGFVALLRIIQNSSFTNFGGSSSETFRLWCATIFWIMAVASMFLGNVLALLQRNLNRLLAYSSISHAGYMLVGLAIGQRPAAIGGVAALLFYLVAYGATIAGVFGLLVLLRRESRPVENVEDLAGLSRTHPAAAAVLTILLFSLTGLPPTAGFLGKLNLLMAAWSQRTTSAEILAILLAVNAAIAAAYYLRIVGVMYLRPAVGTIETSRQIAPLVGVALCLVVSLGLFFFPGYLWDIVDQFAA